MKEAIYHSMADVEGKHWWFSGRRTIVDSFLRRLGLGPDAQILEIGCGTGGNLELLARYGQVSAMDTDPNALDYANESTVATVKRGALPDDVPFAGPFDLVVLLDVLEHIDDDVTSLSAIHSLVRPGGHVLFTVPAFQFLWSAHDEVHHHKRRYTRGELTQKITNAGIRVEKATYFNTFLFPAVLATRWLEKVSSRAPEADLEVPAKPVNLALQCVFGAERHLLRAGNFPYGVSLLAVGSRPN